MDRRVRIVQAADQQHLPVQLMHPPHRALGPMRRQRQGIGKDTLGMRPQRGAGEMMR
jgi:hypothetical protein